MPQQDLPALLNELEERGVTGVRRKPARFDGYVEVEWDESPREREQRLAMMRGWLRLGVITVALVVLAVGIGILLIL